MKNRKREATRITCISILIINILMYVLAIIILFLNMIHQRDKIPNPKYSSVFAALIKTIQKKFIGLPDSDPEAPLDILAILYIVTIFEEVNDIKACDLPFNLSLRGITRDYYKVKRKHKTQLSARSRKSPRPITFPSKEIEHNIKTIEYFFLTNPFLRSFELELKPKIANAMSSTSSIGSRIQECLKNKKVQLLPRNPGEFYFIEKNKRIKYTLYLKVRNNLQTATSAEESVQYFYNPKTQKNEKRNFIKISTLVNEDELKICQLQQHLYLVFSREGNEFSTITHKGFRTVESIEILKQKNYSKSVLIYKENPNSAEELVTWEDWKAITNKKKETNESSDINNQEQPRDPLFYILITKYDFSVVEGKLSLAMKITVGRIKEINDEEENGKEVDNVDNFKMNVYYSTIEKALGEIPVFIK